MAVPVQAVRPAPVEPVKVAPAVEDQSQHPNFEASIVNPRVLSRAEAHALAEARLMMRMGRIGHPMGCAPGARFSGTGMGPSQTCNTCVPGRRMTLIADARVRNPLTGYWFRSRHWR